jgi:organic radical activating enzyme
MELDIFLGELCNYECAHCVTNSSPKTNDIRITSSEIEKLSSIINKYSKIKRVHFTGGEPTLFINEIKKIQGLITRPVKYIITTNGWFGSKKIFENVIIDEVVLSLDSYHLKFNNKKIISKTIAYLSSIKNLKISINSVHDEDLENLRLISNLGLDDIELSLNRLVYTGRAKKELVKIKHKDNSGYGFCPSFGERAIGMDRVIFIPSKGYTPCCSYLSYGKEAPESLVYESEFKKYEEGFLYTLLHRKNFAEILSDIGVQNKSDLNYSNSCEVCKDLMVPLGQKSTMNIYSAMSKEFYELEFQVNDFLDTNQEKILSRKYEIGYVFSRENARASRDMNCMPGEKSLTCKEIKEIVINNIYEKYCEYISKKRANDISEKLYEFYLNANHIVLKKEDGDVLYCLIANVDNNRAHIGFIYVSKKISDREERNNILEQLFDTLFCNDIDEVTARVDWFNYPSRRLFQNKDFQVKGVKLEAK